MIDEWGTLVGRAAMIVVGGGGAVGCLVLMWGGIQVGLRGVWAEARVIDQCEKPDGHGGSLFHATVEFTPLGGEPVRVELGSTKEKRRDGWVVLRFDPRRPRRFREDPFVEAIWSLLLFLFFAGWFVLGVWY
ncbi:hypothetical protein ACWCYY_40680 [Kitasatospora sp. NPDC001664]